MTKYCNIIYYCCTFNNKGLQLINKYGINDDILINKHVVYNIL